MKERITLTLDAEIIKQIDQSIDGFLIKNRSHAIELLLLKSLKRDIARHAIILAAGKEDRVEKDKPNGMLLVQNKPVMAHLIELFKKYGIKDILIGVCYGKEQIKSYFGNGHSFGVRIRYIEEDEPSGTINIVQKAKPFLSGNFFVTNSDELKDISLRDMFRTHKENNALATLALTTVKDPKSYGVVHIDGTRIKEFLEKPKDEKQANMINAGLYLMELEVLDMIPKGMKMFYDFFPTLAEQDKLIVILFQESGSIQARKWVLRKRIRNGNREGLLWMIRYSKPMI